MKFRFLAVVPALALVVLAMTAPRVSLGAVACPSPAPTCSSSGILSDLSGIFGCTAVITLNSGQVEVDVLKIDSDGAGNISGSIVSNNNGSGTTFSDFTSVAGATYCLNTDDTGYVFGFGSPCPKALIVDDALGEVRMIGSGEGVAQAITCRLQ